MAPSIPTRRPLLTATRLAVSIAVAASASSLYLAFGSAWAAPLQAPDAQAVALCPAVERTAEALPLGIQAPLR